MNKQNKTIASIPEISKTDILVLCGGLGERLRSVIGNGQKVMATVSGQPFLDLLLRDLIHQGCKRVILLTGYKAETIIDYYRKKKFPLSIEFSLELEPLGTGGAIKNAESLIKSNPFIVMNGDSFCSTNYQEFLEYHARRQAAGSIVVTKLENRSDYGTIVLDEKNRIIDFQEKVKSDNLKQTPEAKSFTPPGRVKNSFYVNAGIYCFNKTILAGMPKGKFSLEREFIPKSLAKEFYGFVIDQPLTDIGTPQRYEKAQTELNNNFLDKKLPTNK